MNPLFDNDSYVYDSFGRFFYEHTTLFDPTFTLVPMQPLGYHFFVGLVYKLCGPGMGGIIAAQVILFCVIAWLTYRIAQRITDRVTDHVIARVALILCLTNLGLLVYTPLLLAEILLTCLCMAFFDRILAYHERPRMTTLAAAAFFLSCSSLVKPIAFLFCVPLFFLLVRWHGIRDAISFMIFFSLPLAAYLLRNWFCYGVWMYAPMVSVNLYQCFLSKVHAVVEGCSVNEAFEKLAPTGAHLFDPQGWDAQKKLFWQYVFHNPFTCLFVWLQNVAKTMFGLYTTQLKMMFNPALRGGAASFFLIPQSGLQAFWAYLWVGTSSWALVTIGLAEMVWNGIRMALLAFGFSGLYRQHTRFTILTAIFCVMTIMATGVDGCARYRVVTEPLLCIMIAGGFVTLYRWFMRRKSTFAIVLAGGSGERLWPISRQAKPKQFLVLGSSKTLLDQAIDRVAGVVGLSHVRVVMSAQHAAHAVRTQTIVEPEPRNTAAAILLSCFRIAAHNPNSVMVIVSADAFIPESHTKKFQVMVAHACAYARDHDELVLFGATPTHAATGYGYIEYVQTTSSIHPVMRFHEKPTASIAQLYVAQPNILWNMGMFVGRVEIFMQEFERHAPAVYETVQAYVQGRGAYEVVPMVSFDCAVVEKSTRVCVLPVSFSWCDVGTLESFVQVKQQHEQSAGNVIQVNVRNTIVDVPDDLVALIDVEDLCVVKRAGVLVISKRAQTEKVREVVMQVKERSMKEYQ